MIELGARYRAGREVVYVVYADGSVAQLDPFQSIRFEQQPLRIKGKLTRVYRGRPVRETKVVA